MAIETNRANTFEIDEKTCILTYLCYNKFVFLSNEPDKGIKNDKSKYLQKNRLGKCF